jgi:hypothetical protein
MSGEVKIMTELNCLYQQSIDNKGGRRNKNRVSMENHKLIKIRVTNKIYMRTLSS